MDVVEAIHTRRSIRDYAARALDRPLIEALIWDAAQAPPPFAGQVPWTFNAVCGAERIARYGSQARQYALDHRPDGEGPFWADREEFKVFWDAPALVIISGRVEDCCRAGQLLVLSAHARGLGACWVGSPMQWLRTPEAKSEIGIPEEAEPVSAICLGYPASTPPPLERGRPAIFWRE
ncbi:nitroreductase family protein [Caulobacter sp. KR2-114]|uniref:nitroreductase family protein n=1 Tax=Caulobacter sp. KR2-114 TaxID=3400912 RepID=UPI003C0081B8